MPRGCAMQTMQSFYRVDGDSLRRVAQLRDSDAQSGADEPTDQIAAMLSAEPWSTDETIHVHDLAAEIESEFPGCQSRRSDWAFGPYWPRRCCARVFRLG